MVRSTSLSYILKSSTSTNTWAKVGVIWCNLYLSGDLVIYYVIASSIRLWTYFLLINSSIFGNFSWMSTFRQVLWISLTNYSISPSMMLTSVINPVIINACVIFLFVFMCCAVLSFFANLLKSSYLGFLSLVYIFLYSTVSQLSLHLNLSIILYRVCSSSS